MSMKDHPHKSGEWNNGVKTGHGTQKRGNFAPKAQNNNVPVYLGTGNDRCLTATHKRGTHSSTFRVKNNIVVPARKLHREFRHKELEFGLFLLPDVPQAHSLHI